LTEKEVEAIKKYQGVSYTLMNGFLRGKYSDISNELREHLENLQKAIKKVKIKENILVARGTTTSAIGGDWNTTPIKDIIINEGFMSTSLREKTAIDFANRKEERGILMYIKIPKGTNGIIVDVAVNDSWESELLLEPGTKIRITGKELKTA
jgi:rubrerythrin